MAGRLRHGALARYSAINRLEKAVFRHSATAKTRA